MRLTGTHTNAVLTVSHDAHYEIAEALREAGYSHAFQPDPDLPEAELIDMSGIALRDTVVSHSAKGEFPPEMTTNLAIKLGSAIVHADESMSEGRAVEDTIAFHSAINDPEVKAFLATLDRLQFLPLRRDEVRYS